MKTGIPCVKFGLRAHYHAAKRELAGDLIERSRYVFEDGRVFYPAYRESKQDKHGKWKLGKMIEVSFSEDGCTERQKPTAL